MLTKLVFVFGAVVAATACAPQYAQVAPPPPPVAQVPYVPPIAQVTSAPPPNYTPETYADRPQYRRHYRRHYHRVVVRARGPSGRPVRVHRLRHNSGGRAQ